MENYMLKFNTYDKYIVYSFSIGSGGIGDLIKYFMFLINLCMSNNIRLYYLNHNIFVNRYLKLKYKQMYITQQQIDHNYTIIDNIDDISILSSNKYYVIKPNKIRLSVIFPEFAVQSQDVFSFTEEVEENAKFFVKSIRSDINEYVSIHLRLGDKFLETDARYIQCIYDDRRHNEPALFEFIKQYKDKKIVFFCDNNSYKLKIKALFPHVYMTNYEIGHTSLGNTTEIETLNTVTEFYLLTNSSHIYRAAYSGFPVAAAGFKSAPIDDIIIIE